VRSSQWRKRTRVEIFEDLEFFQGRKKVCRSSGGAATTVGSAGGKEIWTVGFHVQGAAGGAHRKNRIGPLDLDPETQQS
jgi:hypothetical protein